MPTFVARSARLRARRDMVAIYDDYTQVVTRETPQDLSQAENRNYIRYLAREDLPVIDGRTTNSSPSVSPICLLIPAGANPLHQWQASIQGVPWKLGRHSITERKV